jgi:hypothetical protein
MIDECVESVVLEERGGRNAIDKTAGSLWRGSRVPYHVAATTQQTTIQMRTPLLSPTGGQSAIHTPCSTDSTVDSARMD